MTVFRAFRARAQIVPPAGHMPRPPAPVRSIEAEAKQIEAWWAEPRWKELARPWSAVDVVALRGGLQQTPASDAMARKLHATLEECVATGGHSRTFGGRYVSRQVTSGCQF